MTAETSTRQDDDGCHVIHVDMDAFFAAVATRDRPELRDVPVVVGGGQRGVVLSATYPARAYGIRSGIPMTRARRLCPQVRVIVPDFDDVSATSKAVMEVFRRYTPRVDPVSVDEAFLDVSGSLRQYRSAVQIGEEIRARVADEQQITCSVGVASSAQLAKLASRRAKPDGLVVVPRDEVVSFLHPLPIDQLWGVGAKTAARLNRLGLRTVGDLAHTPIGLLRRALGQSAGSHVHSIAWGIDRRRIMPAFGYGEPEHSMGADETFGRDVDDHGVVLRELLRLSTKVARRMRSHGLSGRTVTLRVRFADFTTITRSRTLPQYTNVTPEIYATAADLFGALGLHDVRLRLVGVRVEGLLDTGRTARQLLLGQRPYGWEEAEAAADLATGRFGRDAVRPATLVDTRRP